MASLAADPIAWMPMVGLTTFVAVHGALLAVLLYVG
jgi:hypothetical protein